MKILLVDDTPANLDVLRKTLQPKGFEISIAPDGERALMIASKFLPDLILLDVMMPGIDGFETCSQLKSKELTKEIPVIFISAKNESEDIVNGLSLGGVDYITKPFKQEEVLARVETHLKLQFLKKEQEKSKRDIKQKALEVIKKNKELQKTIEKLKSTQEQLIQSEKFASLGCLTSGICHEILNPISIISGQVQALVMERESDQELVKDLDSIKEETERVEEIIDRLDKYVNQETPQAVPNDVNDHLTKGLDDLEKEGRFEKISVIRDLNPDVPKVDFDDNLIGQVFQNILNNALFVMNQEGTLTVKTEVTSKAIKQNSSSPSANRGEENFVRISVSDTGPGIETKDLSKIFDPFFTTKPPGQGMGLGLSVCYSIMEKHGGSIEADSEESTGATFSLFLPVNPVVSAG